MARKNYVLFKLQIKLFFTVERKWEKTYYTKEQLVDYIAFLKLWRKLDIFDRLAPDMSEETTRKPRYNDPTLYFICRQTIKKGQVVLVDADIDMLKKEVEIHLDKLNKKDEQQMKEVEYNRKSLKSEFRREPVSSLCKNKFNYRHVHYYKNRRMYIMDKLTPDDLENSDNIKSSKNKHKNKELYLDCYSYRVAHMDRNWKTSFKAKKQWDKHTKHGDKIAYNKRSLYHFDIDAENIDELLEADFLKNAS